MRLLPTTISTVPVVTSVASCGPKSSSIPNPVVDTPPSAAFSKGNSIPSSFPSHPVVCHDASVALWVDDNSGETTSGSHKNVSEVCTTSCSSCSFPSFNNLLQSYSHLLPITPNPNSAAATLPDFDKYLNSLIPRFKPGGVEDAAISAAEDFSWENYAHLVSTMSPLSTIEGLLLDVSVRSSSNQSRFTAASAEVLSDDPDFELLLEIGEKGATIDFDPLFVKQSIPQKYRRLEKRMMKVFSLHAVKAVKQDRGLILETSSIPPSELAKLHFNPQFWTYKPDDPLGRWLIDCSNRSDVNLALNSGSSKQLVVNRYGAVSFPSVLSMISAWLAYMDKEKVSWRDCWFVKKDIKSCFPQFSFSPESSPLLAIRLDDNHIFIHTSGCFGWTGSPMVWGVIGNALLRKCRNSLSCPIDLYCDDFMAFGVRLHTEFASSFIENFLRKVFHEKIVATEKSVFSQIAVILGWLIDLSNPLGAVMRPKDEAIDKLCFLLFSFDQTKPQPLSFWQSLQSLTERYSLGLRGMRGFVAPFSKMVSLSTPSSSPRPLCSPVAATPRPSSYFTKATNSALFAIEVWRVVMYLLWSDREAFNVKLEDYLVLTSVDNSKFPCRFRVVTDASWMRVAAAVYDNQSHSILAWTSFPFVGKSGTKNKYQLNREYLGLLLAFCLIAFRWPQRWNSGDDLSFRWVNDNKAALAFCESQKASSISSQLAALAVVWFPLYTKITNVGSEYLPGSEMGDIDRESRREKHLLDGVFNVSPSLRPELFCVLPSVPAFQSLMAICDPSRSNSSTTKVLHLSFLTIHELLSVLAKL
jgi:hypothetical protein